jgi:serine/threonine protein kinase
LIFLIGHIKEAFEFLPRDIPTVIKDLIKALMTVDPEKRYTADQALACKWIQRPELQRFLSDKGLGIIQSSRMSTVEDQLSQSVRDWNFHLDGSFASPVPMQWITESPRVLKVNRKHFEGSQSRS